MKMTTLCLLALFMSFLTPRNSWAAKMAIVSSGKAVIYADQGLTTPLGFVRSGRQLMVGETVRQSGTLLPVVVAGRIAYIQLKDVVLSDDDLVTSQNPQGPKVIEHEIDIPMDEITDDLKENNHVSFQVGQYFAGSQLEELSLAAGVEDGAVTSYKLMFEHRPVIYRYFWDVGLGYYGYSTEAFTLRALTLEGNYYYSLLQTRFLTVQAFAGVILSGDFRLTSDLLQVQSKGSAYGYQFGGSVKMATRQKIGFIGNMSMQTIIPNGVETLGFILNDGSDKLTKLQGLHFSLGVVYKF